MLAGVAVNDDATYILVASCKRARVRDGPESCKPGCAFSRLQAHRRFESTVAFTGENGEMPNKLPSLLCGIGRRDVGDAVPVEVPDPEPDAGSDAAIHPDRHDRKGAVAALPENQGPRSIA